MLKGVLEGCVLEIISRGETYGYEITRRLNALGFTDVVEGTVYTILVRLEKNKARGHRKKAVRYGAAAQVLRAQRRRGVRNCADFGENGNLLRRKSTN